MVAAAIFGFYKPAAVVVVGWNEEAAGAVGGASSVGNTALLWLCKEWLETSLCLPLLSILS